MGCSFPQQPGGDGPAHPRSGISSQRWPEETLSPERDRAERQGSGHACRGQGPDPAGLIPARLQTAGAQPAESNAQAVGQPAPLGAGAPPPAHRQHPSRPLLDYIFQKGGGEVVIGNVARIEEQPPVRAPFLGSGQGDLAVLYHLVDTIHSAHHADRLRGVSLLHHLPKGSAVRERPPMLCASNILPCI